MPIALQLLAHPSEESNTHSVVGFEVILRMETGKLSGIVNGIDYQTNDPENDPYLPFAF